jgi:hypothetical protein
MLLGDNFWEDEYEKSDFIILGDKSIPKRSRQQQNMKGMDQSKSQHVVDK